MELLSAHQISGGAVLATSHHTLSVPAGPLARTHRAMSTSVLVRDDADPGCWRVASTHNTLVTA
jgi:hypothetical protein